jgi:hypothetical protein
MIGCLELKYAAKVHCKIVRLLIIGGRRRGGGRKG